MSKKETEESFSFIPIKGERPWGTHPQDFPSLGVPESSASFNPKLPAACCPFSFSIAGRCSLLQLPTSYIPWTHCFIPYSPLDPLFYPINPFKSTVLPQSAEFQPCADPCQPQELSCLGWWQTCCPKPGDVLTHSTDVNTQTFTHGIVWNHISTHLSSLHAERTQLLFWFHHSHFSSLKGWQRALAQKEQLREGRSEGGGGRNHRIVLHGAEIQPTPVFHLFAKAPQNHNTALAEHAGALYTKYQSA